MPSCQCCQFEYLLNSDHPAYPLSGIFILHIFYGSGLKLTTAYCSIKAQKFKWDFYSQHTYTTSKFSHNLAQRCNSTMKLYVGSTSEKEIYHKLERLFRLKSQKAVAIPCLPNIFHSHLGLVFNKNKKWTYLYSILLPLRLVPLL